MNRKKILAAALAGAMVLTASPVLPVSVDLASTAYAAKGGAKFAPKAAPKVAPVAPKASTGNAGKSVSGNGSGYAPSKDAKSLDKNAPAPNAATRSNAAGAQANQSSSRLGSIMRGIGLFAGGMFLGSMLSHFFGMGGMMGGMMGDIMGLLMNVVLLVAAIFVIRWLWNKFRGRREEEPSPYRQNFSAPAPRETIDVTPRQKVQDIQPPADAGYNARQTADRYRNR